MYSVYWRMDICRYSVCWRMTYEGNVVLVNVYMEVLCVLVNGHM